MNEESSGNPPSQPYRFPLELVATIAAILQGCESVGEALREASKPAGRRKGYLDPNNLEHTIGGRYPDPDAIIADTAVSLLYACERRLQQDEFFAAFKDLMSSKRTAEEEAEAKRRAKSKQLVQDFPNGCAFKKGVLYITGKKSEADAMKPYRQWLLYIEIMKLEPFVEEKAVLSLIALEAAKKGKSYKFADIEDSARIVTAAKQKVEEQFNKLKETGYSPSQLHKEGEAFQAWYSENKISLARKQGGFAKAMPVSEKKTKPI